MRFDWLIGNMSKVVFDRLKANWTGKSKVYFKKQTECMTITFKTTFFDESSHFK